MQMLSIAVMNRGDDEDLYCLICDRSFESVAPLRSHLRVCGLEPGFPCRQCKYRASRDSHLQLHIRKHHPKKRTRDSRCTSSSGSGSSVLQTPGSDDDDDDLPLAKRCTRVLRLPESSGDSSDSDKAWALRKKICSYVPDTVRRRRR